MYETLSPSLCLYRVTGRATRWTKVLLGLGAFYTDGGRYNRANQTTVYASDDPIVVISEYAYHKARAWQEKLSETLMPPSAIFPLLSAESLWAFCLNQDMKIVDLRTETACRVFGYPLFCLAYPSHEYEATRRLADKVRIHPDPAHRAATGLRTVSVRTESHKDRGTQIVLFPGPNKIGATQLEKMNLTIEFLDGEGHSVHSGAKSIDWAHPRFRIEKSAGAVPLISAGHRSSAETGYP